MRWLSLLLCACGPSGAQVEEMRGLFASGEAALLKSEQAFAAAAQKRPPPAAGAPCKVEFQPADGGQFADRLISFIALQGSDGPLQASTVTWFTPKARLDSLESGSVEARRAEQKKLLDRESWYGDLNAKKWVEQGKKLAAEPLAPELLIEIGASVGAQLIDGKSFQGGVMVGKAWLYSPSENRFVCAGNVVAASSKSVEVWQWNDSPRSDGKIEVTSDLYLNMMTEAEKSLKAL